MPSQIARIWALSGLALALIAGSILLFAGGPDAYAARSYRELWNLGHILYFALIVLGFSFWPLFRRLPLLWQWPLLLGFALCWGWGVEQLQYGSDRTTDMMDVSRDLSGALLMLAFHPAYLEPGRVVLRRVLRLLALAYFIYHLIPLALAITDETCARFQFPVLSDFSTPFELERWDGSATRAIVSDIGGRTGRQMKIALTTERYSGVGLKFLPQDWSAYQVVVLEIYSPYETALPVTIRIHDRIHQTREPAFQFNDRFNKRFRLLKGWNHISIDLAEVARAPVKRTMDMQHIADISLFSSALQQPRTLFLDSVYLAAGRNQ